jgi:hypothetical protein
MLSKIAFSLLTIVVSSCFTSNVGADTTDITTHGGIRGWKDRTLQTVVVGQVDQLILYDAGTDQPILTLTDGMVVNSATLNVNSFNIEATTVNGAVGSVKFGYNGNSKIRVEASAPYAMCGNSGTDFAVCTYLVVGQHTVTATSYSGTKADGTVGTTKTITFQIVNGASPPLPAPVMAPIPAPTTVVVTKSPTKAPINAPVSTSPTTPDSCLIPKVSSTRWMVKRTFD